jgi:PilZ domain
VRFHLITQEFAAIGARPTVAASRGATRYPETIPRPQQGETVKLSERGIRCKTRHRLSVGESVEIFFTLPTELTGRAIEEVKCNTRVVHVDREADGSGQIGVGAAIERIERTSAIRITSRRPPPCYFARRGPTVKVTLAAVVLSN